MKKNKAIFLDRDGVINHDPGAYTTNLSEFEVLPGVYETLKTLSDSGYLLILITNQGGIAKGLYSHEDVHEIHDFFKSECEKYGFQITNIYYSPHHEITGKSLTRKPGSLMIERAIGRYNIDPSLSYMIGDKDRDIDCGEKAGVQGIKIDVNSQISKVLEMIDNE